ncbi:MAG: cobyrinate a,c-diamide synthase [Eubacterium sp.]|nr:cobyrinate a,c-diamide synthase [Eubacterium sp.]
MNLPRIMLTAPASGSGKTLITCGILQALKNRGVKLAAFKTGPDYIDPMFHGRIIGIPSKNLDRFFIDKETTKYLFARQASQVEFSVMEGAMGYYDGIAGSTTEASGFDVATITDTPAVLIINTKGMSLSIGAIVQGFLQFQPDSRIRGVIFNHMTSTRYEKVKAQIESAYPVKVLGYVPTVKDCVIESRHLGLVTPNDVENLQERLQKLAAVMEETIDFDALLELGQSAPALEWKEPEILQTFQSISFENVGGASNNHASIHKKVRIGIAKDEAFCFFYQDNLDLLEQLGAELVYFSPIWDEHLPENLQGLIFYGGYPELYAKKLSENQTMLTEIRQAIDEGMPYLAECGGFMYLHEQMQDMEGISHPMVGAIKGEAFKTSKLGGRFGYISLLSKKNQIFGTSDMEYRGHEFHYFDSTSCGEDFHAQKPLMSRGWDCIHADENHVAGFPHFYYYSNPQMAINFLKRCEGELP